MEILVVEDSPEVSLVTVEYLAELGHRAVCVSDAEGAVEQLARRSFDAVMTDVSLPGMSGIELTRELVRRYPRLPVVIASGYGVLNIDALLNGGGGKVSVLPKPYDMETLQRTLHEATAPHP